MTTAQHTPGPWTYEGDHTHRQFNIRMLGHLIGTRDEAKHICTVNNLPSHVLANRDAGAAEANARLIAAAPDMLEALRAIATYMRGDLTTDDFKSLRLKRGDMTGNVRRIAENVLTRIDGEAAP